MIWVSKPPKTDNQIHVTQSMSWVINHDENRHDIQLYSVKKRTSMANISTNTRVPLIWLMLIEHLSSTGSDLK